MAKKKERIDKSQTGEGPFNNALAGLATLRDQMGPADKEAPERPPPPESPRSVSDVSGLPLAQVGRLIVRKERKGRGGKTVTRIEGLPQEEQASWARTMAKALGCGASVEDGCVFLQGSQSRRAAEWLRGQGARRVTVGDSA